MLDIDKKQYQIVLIPSEATINYVRGLQAKWTEGNIIYADDQELYVAIDKITFDTNSGSEFSKTLSFLNTQTPTPLVFQRTISEDGKLKLAIEINTTLSLIHLKILELAKELGMTLPKHPYRAEQKPPYITLGELAIPCDISQIEIYQGVAVGAIIKDVTPKNEQPVNTATEVILSTSI